MHLSILKVDKFILLFKLKGPPSKILSKRDYERFNYVILTYKEMYNKEQKNSHSETILLYNLIIKNVGE